MDSTNRSKVKSLAAVFGVGAVVTMGALTLGLNQQVVGPNNVASGKMTLGATATTTTPPTVEATSMAVPAIKGPPKSK